MLLQWCTLGDWALRQNLGHSFVIKGDFGIDLAPSSSIWCLVARCFFAWSKGTSKVFFPERESLLRRAGGITTLRVERLGFFWRLHMPRIQEKHYEGSGNEPLLSASFVFNMQVFVLYVCALPKLQSKSLAASWLSYGLTVSPQWVHAHLLWQPCAGQLKCVNKLDAKLPDEISTPTKTCLEVEEN